MASDALRLGLSFWLAFSILYTPVHLSLEPHFDDAGSGSSAPQTNAAVFVGDPDQDGHGHSDQHPAAQHKLKALRSQRAPLAELGPVPVVRCMDVEEACPRPPMFDFTGLPPPELPRCWQFLFRAALPIRAPSSLS
jgi:hypothetical protein